VRVPPLDWWLTVFVYIPVLTVWTVACGTVSLVSTLVDRRGHFAHGCARVWAQGILLTTGVRLERGGHPVPPSHDSCVFVANHASFFDIPIIFAALPHQLRIMAKEKLSRVPFIGWHLRLAGHVLVNRENPGAGILKRMQRMTRQNASLIVFPEAGRSADGSVERFKPGIFLLAIQHRLPVVPVTIDGSRHVMPPGRLSVARERVRVVVHDPIATDAFVREDARDLAERARQVVASGLGRVDHGLD
jgi:1-acyl-sn-glycerol-3-phosphate acyltransferase